MRDSLLRSSDRSVSGFAILWVLTLVILVAGCNRGADPADNGDSAKSAPVCPSFQPASEGLPTSQEWRTHPAIGDVNGDGLGDIAVMARKGDGPKVFLHDGLGGWTDASDDLVLERGFSCGVGTRLVDMNLDGHIDLLVADHCTGVRVFLGDGGETWQEASRGIPRNLQGFNDAAAGDLNGDGIPDIVAISAYSRGFLVLLGQPDSSYKVVHGTGLPDVGSAFRIRLVDVDGDGLLDILLSFNITSRDTRSDPPPPAKVWLQNGDGTFSPTSGFLDEGRDFGIGFRRQTGEQKVQIVTSVTGALAGIHIFESPAGVEWTPLGRIDEGWAKERHEGFLALDVADMNGDGCDDLVATGGSPHGVWLVVSDCEGNWYPCAWETLSMEEPDVPGWGVITGDLNGDGRLDVVAAHGARGEGHVKAWLQTPGEGRHAGDHGQGPDESSADRP